jgi:hypothetical protein
MSSQQIPNPHHPGAPARMADGRLFTDFRQNCALLPKRGGGVWADWERHQSMKRTGEVAMKSDRGLTVMRAASYGCVDTMVPELTKRVYSWNGPVELPCQAAGIGTGRSYLPGRPDLVGGDPDVLAAATFPAMFSAMPGTFSTNMALYTAVPQMPPVPVGPAPARVNRYAPPHATVQ